MISRCPPGGIEDARQLPGFVAQRGKFGGRQQFGPLRQFDPKLRFVRLFENNGNFIDEIAPGLAAQSRSVIGRNRCSAANNLMGNRPSREALRERLGKSKDTNRKICRSLPEISGIHAAILDRTNH